MISLHLAKKGALLLELLIAISVLAVVLSVGSQAVFVSMQSGKVSGERDVAMGLAAEALEASRAFADEKWQNLYLLAKATQHYYATSTVPTGKWTLATGDEVITIGGISYTRYLLVRNVCRESSSTRNITGITDTDGLLTTCGASGGDLDPSTQKVSVSVSWSGGDPVTISDYFFRWRNKACNQTGWSGGKTYPSDPAPAEVNCPQSLTTYYNDDGNIDNTTAPGSLKLK